MGNTERLLKIKENYPTIYEKYLAPLENKANLLTDMRNTECLLRLKKNDPTIY
jgi:hypothetical protein